VTVIPASASAGAGGVSVGLTGGSDVSTIVAVGWGAPHAANKARTIVIENSTTTRFSLFILILLPLM
jgi:hypothetical protein